MGRSFAQFAAIVTGQRESGACGSFQLSGVSGLVVIFIVITNIICSVLFLWVGLDILVKFGSVSNFCVFAILVVLVQLDAHLCHEGVPVHTVTVKDFFIDLFLMIP